MRRLLAVAVVLVIAKDAVPYGLEAWEERGFEQRRQRFIALKDREIQCLDRLIKSAVPKGADAGAEIERCRQLAVDPATGRYASFP